MSNPMALLYDSEHKVRGYAGIMIRPDEAVFSPWPEEIGYTQPFVVRVRSDSGTGSDWLTPAAVEYVRLEGAAESSNVAILAFTQATGQPVTSPPGIPEQAVVDALTATDCRRAVAGLCPPLFTGFGSRRASAAEAALTPEDVASMPAVTVASSFQVVTGSPAAVQESICRIFRWD